MNSLPIENFSDEVSSLNVDLLTLTDPESSANEIDAVETIEGGGWRNRRKNRRQIKPRSDTEAKNESDRSLEQPIENQCDQNLSLQSQSATNDNELPLQQRVKTSSDSSINHNVRRQKELQHKYKLYVQNARQVFLNQQNPNFRQHQSESYNYFQPQFYYPQNQFLYYHLHQPHFYYCLPYIYYQHYPLIWFHQHHWHLKSHGFCNHCNEP